MRCAQIMGSCPWSKFSRFCIHFFLNRNELMYLLSQVFSPWQKMECFLLRSVNHSPVMTYGCRGPPSMISVNHPKNHQLWTNFHAQASSLLCPKWISCNKSCHCLYHWSLTEAVHATHACIFCIAKWISLNEATTVYVLPWKSYTSGLIRVELSCKTHLRSFICIDLLSIAFVCTPGECITHIYAVLRELFLHGCSLHSSAHFARLRRMSIWLQ